MPRSRRSTASSREDEIKTLVVDDKWLATLAAAVQGELDRVSQTLTGRIRQLAERYATPLPQLTGEVADARRPRGRTPQEDGGGMELKPGYKQTEVGVIPEEWEDRSLLGNVVDRTRWTRYRAHANSIRKTVVPLIRVPIDRSANRFIVTRDYRVSLQRLAVAEGTRNVMMIKHGDHCSICAGTSVILAIHS